MRRLWELRTQAWADTKKGLTKFPEAKNSIFEKNVHFTSVKNILRC